MWDFIRVRYRKRRSRVRKRRSGVHYRAHKEAARALIHARLQEINTTHFNFSYNRVAIKDQKSRWGSCSKKGNLNFNYRLLFLPSHLADYVIAHELAHLKEFNHGKDFWALVAQASPEYKKHRAELQRTRIVRGKAISSTIAAS